MRYVKDKDIWLRDWLLVNFVKSFEMKLIVNPKKQRGAPDPKTAVAI